MDPVDFFGLQMQQSVRGLETLATLLNKEMPKRVIELGTGAGGLSLLLESWCLRHKAGFATYDIKQPERHATLYPAGGLWQHGDFWKLLPPDLFGELDSPGKTLLLCDGGNKPLEVNKYAPELRVGDIVGVHDYCISRKVFRKLRRRGGWRSCEVVWADIKDVITTAFEPLQVNPKCGWGFWRKVR